MLGQTPAQPPAAPEGRWYRGNLHTHSLWSDGDHYPEMIVAWYKEHGYDFLALSDHNVLSVGQRWIDPAAGRGGVEALALYKARFGPNWVEQKELDGKTVVRLKPLAEFRHLFEEPGKFLMIQGEEITDHVLDPGGTDYPVHLNATNLLSLIPPQGGATVAEAVANNVRALEKQAEITGQPMLVHLNHPNYGWAVVAEDLIAVKEARFFEVYNGHPSVRNYGDAQHASMERMWDIVLTARLTSPRFEGGAEGVQPAAESKPKTLYGVAVDDSHNYHQFSALFSNPGRGWVMVRTKQLTPEAIVTAMQRGDFYASTGVRLKDIRFDGKTLQILIDAEERARYRTQFIGTRKGFDPASKPVLGENGQELHITRTYSNDIGQVLAQSDSLEPAYTPQGDELYVRARITSSKAHPNPFAKADPEMAWTQPVIPAQ